MFGKQDAHFGYFFRFGRIRIAFLTRSFWKKASAKAKRRKLANLVDLFFEIAYSRTLKKRSIDQIQTCFRIR